MDKISIIVPSYNRFNYLINALDSIRKQTYQNIEIIVVNDCSTDEQYYLYDWEDIKIIHLEKNSKELFGYGSYSNGLNHGIQIATGKYIAFCDDDDIWFPKKIELQLNSMKKTKCKMACAEALTGEGIYNKNKTYLKMSSEKHFKTIQKIYKKKANNELKKGFPNIFTRKFIKIHNCIIHSSVIIEKKIIDKVGKFIITKHNSLIKRSEHRKLCTDYNYWMRVLKHTNCVFFNEPLIYYDNKHGEGTNS
jgi:glycosyltransferase involved in cell wall biosynthesis